MDIDFLLENNRFNARASAIIFNKDKSKILLFKLDDSKDFYLLPGGRIIFFEDSYESIKREMQEELGYDLDFELCSIQENFLVKDNKKIMQYCFCYKAIYDGEIAEEEFRCKDNNDQLFCWVDIDKLKDYNIVPKSVSSLINTSKLEHIIERCTLE